MFNALALTLKNLMLTHLPNTHYCHQKITEQKVAPDSLNRSIS